MIQLAKQLNRVSLWLFYAALATFLLAGSLSVIENSFELPKQFLEIAFTRAPVWLVFLTVPLSTGCAFLLVRMGVMMRGFVAFVFLLCFALTAGFKLFGLSSWIAAAAWVGVIYMLKVNIKRFEQYLLEKTQHHS